MKRLILVSLALLLLIGSASALTWTSASGCWTASSGGVNYVMWNATGISTWHVPTGVSSINYTVTAGGGSAGGSYGGGQGSGAGGAGGVLNGTGYAVTAGTNVYVYVGTGATGVTGGTNGNNGANSSFANTTVINGLQALGGGGGGFANPGSAGGNGGSGGGAGSTGTIGNGASGQGNNGGTGFSTGNQGGGGGGGQAAVGGAGSSTNGGTGGAGLTSWLDGVCRAGGGGGGSAGGTAGTATCGGGNGISVAGAANNGTAATGGGGGGITGANPSGAGGSGVIIISYCASAVAVTPIVSFTSNATSGTPPLPVQFNDTSSLSITTWNWSFTNVTPGNNTKIIWSTIQNATLTLGNGNWNINLNVTNTSGYNETTLAYFVNASPSGGVSGWNRQDILMNGAYLQTFHITDASTGMAIPIVTLLDSNGNTYTTTNGTGYLTETYSAGSVTFTATGYYGKIITYVFDAAASHDVQLTPAPATTSQNANVIFSPREVVFQFLDANNNPLVGKYSSAQAIASTIPGGLSGGLNYFKSVYGVPDSVAATMLSSNVTMSGATDDSGSTVFLLTASIEYNINVIDSNGALFTKTIYPKGLYYQIKTLNATSQSQASLVNSNQNIYNGQSVFVANFTEPNNSYGTMNNFIYDATGHTNGANCWFTLTDNKTTWWNNQTWAYGSGLKILNRTVPIVPYQQWAWGCSTV